MNRVSNLLARLCSVAALMCVPMGLAGCDQQNRSVEVTLTVGDVVAIHDDVSVEGRVVKGQMRISEGETITTGPEGRARLSLDDGATVAVDGKTKLKLEDGKLTIQSGRAFVRGGSQPVFVSWGKASTQVASSSVAFDLRKADQWRAYCPQGEISVEAGGGRH